MSLQEFPLSKAYTFIEPGPVVLVSTKQQEKANVMTISWLTVTDFTPRFALCTGPWNFSFQALRETGECVLNIPTVDLMETVVQIGDCSGREVDKFQRFQLATQPAKIVQAPLLSRCLAAIECQVLHYREADDLFILKGVAAWYDHEHTDKRTFHAQGDGSFILDGERVNLRHLMADKLPPGI